jgi:hypothetical protein
MFKKLVPFLFVGFIALHSSAATASVISELEPNNTAATAQDVDGNFDFAFSADIGDSLGNNTSTTLSHVSIVGLGGGGIDWYTFTSLGGLTILDIDYGDALGGGFMDSELGIWDIGGNLLATNDDAGGPWQGSALDSFIQLSSLTGGTYFVGVGAFDTDFADGFSMTGTAPGAYGTYTLHISTDTSQVPEPSIIALFGLGLVGIGFARRRQS